MEFNYQSSIRGLDIRVAHAQATIAERYSPSNAHADAVLTAMLAAGTQGFLDYGREIYDAPKMFSDEPDLLMFWELGQQKRERDEEMAACPCCKDRWRRPCPEHG